MLSSKAFPLPGEHPSSSGAAPRETLPATECHVWVARVNEVLAGSGAADRYRGWLAPDERERVDRHRFERHRHEHLVSRALARAALCRYTGVTDPGAWIFAAGPRGKPEVARPRLSLPLVFNLANTEGVAVCAVALARQVGVDIEPVDAVSDPLEVAESCFSAAELAVLRPLATADRRRRFIALWTLKEAYVKARGLGLSLPLEAISFDLDGAGGGPPRVSFDARVSDDPAAWVLALEPLPPSYQLAVALNLRPSDPRPVRVVVRETTSLDALAAGRLG